MQNLRKILPILPPAPLTNLEVMVTFILANFFCISAWDGQKLCPAKIHEHMNALKYVQAVVEYNYIDMQEI